MVIVPAPASLGWGPHSSCTDLAPETPPALVCGTRGLRVAVQEGRAWPGFAPRALEAMVCCGFWNNPQGGR